MEIKAVETYIRPPRPTEVFVAGSIEMGAAENWQERLAREFENDPDVVLFNPRRDDWDSSWKQEIRDAQFFEQVSWEMDHIDQADIVFFYFSPGTQSPITLMELGYAVGKGYQCIVCCPEGFWRKGNVDIMCYRNEVPLVHDFETALEFLKAMV